MIYDYTKYDFEKQTEDIICTLTTNENYLFIGRLSGSIIKYTLPHVTIENKLFVKTRP